MSQNFERAKSRLENISSIEPLLSALRTLSMGTWQMALRKIDQINIFEENYQHILDEILPSVEKSNIDHKKIQGKHPELADSIFLIIGTERGLCGKFNDILIENSIDWIKRQENTSYQIWGMGSRLLRKLEQLDIYFTWRQPLPASELSSYKKSFLTTQKWIEQFERNHFNQLFILYNQLENVGQYKFSTYKLLPFEKRDLQVSKNQSKKKWPPPIIETDPKGIYRQIIQNNIASSFNKILLQSAAAEHAARYNLMEEAKDNTEEIIEELQQVINTERKRKITQQMQELAAGAGLLDN